MRLSRHKLLFVLTATMAGFISGLFEPLVFGVRGAILGGALAIGVLFLHPRPADRPAMTIPSTLGLSLIVAGAAFAVICLWQLCINSFINNDEFGVTDFPPVFSALTAWAYAATLLLFYRDRQAGHRRAWAWFVAAPLIGAVLRAGRFREIASVPYTFILGALPFVLLWLLAALIADPAWTRKRRIRYFTPPARTPIA